MVELVYRELRDQLNILRAQVDRTKRIERAEISDSIPAYTLANAPLNADGGLGDGTSYITLAWISNGRRTGEGVGAGTGVLCFHQASTDTWIRLDTYTAVTI